MTEGTREKRRGIGGISTRGASWLAWSACTLSQLLLALSLLAIVPGWSTPLGRGWISWWEQAVSSIGIIGAPILGGLIASRQPHNPYGWLWLGFGLGLTFQHLAESYAAYALVVEPGSLPAPRTISQLLELGGPLALTLVYGSLTAMLALIYVGGVAVTQAIFRALTGQEEQPQLAIVVSTLAIAAFFSPLRRCIQVFIDRRFYRRKYDATKRLEAFSARLRDETNLDALNDELVGVVRETMQPAYLSLWLRPDTAPKKDERPG